MAGAAVVAGGFCTSSGFMISNGDKKIPPAALRLSRSTRKHKSSAQLVIDRHKALSAPFVPRALRSQQRVLNDPFIQFLASCAELVPIDRLSLCAFLELFGSLEKWT